MRLDQKLAMCYDDWEESKSDMPSPRPTTPVRLNRAGFDEMAAVSLVHSVDVAGRPMPAGATGVVVGIYGNGGYEVEFELPFHAVITLADADLTA